MISGAGRIASRFDQLVMRGDGEILEIPKCHPIQDSPFHFYAQACGGKTWLTRDLQ